MRLSPTLTYRNSFYPRCLEPHLIAERDFCLMRDANSARHGSVFNPPPQDDSFRSSGPRVAAGEIDAPRLRGTPISGPGFRMELSRAA